MKYLKTYEKFNEHLKINDWVFLTDWWAGQHLHDFIKEHPAKVINIRPLSNTTTTYEVEYLFHHNNEDDKWIKPFTVTSGFRSISDWVIRKATEEEIEREIMLKDTKTFNI